MILLLVEAELVYEQWSFPLPAFVWRKCSVLLICLTWHVAALYTYYKLNAKRPDLHLISCDVDASQQRDITVMVES